MRFAIVYGIAAFLIAGSCSGGGVRRTDGAAGSGQSDTPLDTSDNADAAPDVSGQGAAPGQPLRTLSVLPAAAVEDGAVRWSLPDGTSSRVMFRVATSGCELGRPVVRIDDLRVE